MINFEFRWGQLLAGDPATDTEWSWEKGDLEIVISHAGKLFGTLSAPKDATVAEIKAIIRAAAKQTANRGPA